MLFEVTRSAVLRQAAAVEAQPAAVVWLGQAGDPLRVFESPFACCVVACLGERLREDGGGPVARRRRGVASAADLRGKLEQGDGVDGLLLVDADVGVPGQRTRPEVERV